MDLNKLKALFIEEANDIIEKMDIDIINFEESFSEFTSSPEQLAEISVFIDELYRGVHTLKGSASAFGFVNLATFVHHFEDSLTIFRQTKQIKHGFDQDLFDLFLESVDIIKQVLQKEIAEELDLPENYQSCLNKIQKLTEIPTDSSSANTGQSTDLASLNKETGHELDLGDEFSNQTSDFSIIEIEQHLGIKELIALHQQILEHLDQIKTISLLGDFNELSSSALLQFLFSAKALKSSIQIPSIDHESYCHERFGEMVWLTKTNLKPTLEQQSAINSHTSQLLTTESLYQISLMVNKNLYQRDLDHFQLLSNLSNIGRLLLTEWDCSSIPNLNSIDIKSAYLNHVNLYFASSQNSEGIAEQLAALESSEFKIEQLFSQLSLSKESTEHKSKEALNKPEEENKKSLKDKLKFLFSEEEELVANSIETNPKTPSNLKNKPVHDKELSSNKSSKEKSNQVIIHEDKPIIKPLIKNRTEIKTSSFVKVDTVKLDELFDSISELVITQNYLSQSKEIQNIENKAVEKKLVALSKITGRMQRSIMSLRMVALTDTFEKMKRVVRDASRKVSKEIHFEIKGSETEIDKTMIEAISEPLIHLIRNAIDHGIESTVDTRKALGKPAAGTIGLNAFHQGGYLAIQIKDDGRGINKVAVFNQAVKQGLIQKNTKLSDSQLYALIMQAGFSTNKKVTDLSGRGVGLDVVNHTLNKLNGRVEIKSSTNRGTTFTLLLPLSLSIIDAMLVKCEDEIFIIPTLHIIESFIPHKNTIHRLKKDGDFVNLRGEMLPIISLSEVLEISNHHTTIEESVLIYIENEKGKYALLVDDIIGRQQIVIKPLSKMLSKVKELSGSAIIGNGDVALILNTQELYLSGESANSLQQSNPSTIL